MNSTIYYLRYTVRELPSGKIITSKDFAAIETFEDDNYEEFDDVIFSILCKLEEEDCFGYTPEYCSIKTTEERSVFMEKIREFVIGRECNIRDNIVIRFDDILDHFDDSLEYKEPDCE